MRSKTHPLGHVFENERVFVFFGDRRSTPETLNHAFPSIRLVGLQQTHSNLVIDSPFEGSAPEGDAHVTRDTGLALGIRTADCVPVMIHDPISGWIAAIHAGWRGIENEIIIKTGEHLLKKGASLNKAEAWIGPHIGPASFEVGHDVAEKLETRFQSARSRAASAALPLTSLLAHLDSEKSRVDLLSITQAQLGCLGIENIQALAIDTFSSSEHQSFRRDRDQAGRQTSFIYLKSYVSRAILMPTCFGDST